MKTESKPLHRKGTLIALALVLVTHCLFYRVELVVDLEDWKLLTEALYFWVFYALIVCEKPPLFAGLWTLFGCAGLCVLHAFTTEYTDYDWILPLSYLPCMLFLLLIYSRQRQDRRLCFPGVWAFLMHCLPWAYLALILYVIHNQKDNGSAFRSDGANQVDAMLALLFLLYLWIICTSPAYGGKTARKRTGESQRRMREPFVFALITMVQAAFFLRFYQVLVLFHTVPLLWLLNLLLLHAQQHPLVCAVTARWAEKATAFLRDG